VEPALLSADQPNHTGEARCSYRAAIDLTAAKLGRLLHRELLRPVTTLLLSLLSGAALRFVGETTSRLTVLLPPAPPPRQCVLLSPLQSSCTLSLFLASHVPHSFHTPPPVTSRFSLEHSPRALPSYISAPPDRVVTVSTHLLFLTTHIPALPCSRHRRGDTTHPRVVLRGNRLPQRRTYITSVLTPASRACPATHRTLRL
jgi:hypothetical protein